MKKLLVILIVLLTWGAWAQADMVPVGSGDWNSSRSTDQLTTYGNWGPGTSTEDGDGFTITWNISQDLDTRVFTYQYTIAGDPKYLESGDTGGVYSNMSHWILEVSNTASNADFWNLSIPSSKGIDEYNPSQGNPEMPANLYGIRWESVDDFTKTGDPNEDTRIYVFSFDTYRQPIWGDFYARCGLGNYAFNTGFGGDPTSGTTDFTPWIAVPDSKVPLPPSALLLGSGLLGLGALGWRRKRS
jgi:hypothetical protein